MEAEINNKSITELLDSINSSIEDIRSHPTKVEKLPSNLEIMVRGVSDSKAVDFLFSSQLESILVSMFDSIQSGNIEKIIENEGIVKQATEFLFGKGAFQGPISNRVLTSISNSMTSYKYNTIKSLLGKTVTQMKKMNFIIRNLERSGKSIKDKEELKKYKDAVYAIKRVLRLAAKIYHNRKILNRRVYEGVKNIVNEEAESHYDMKLIKLVD